MDKALTVNQAAAALSLSRATMYRRINDGTIRTVKLGGRRLVPASEIARVLQLPASEEGSPTSTTP